MAAAVDKGSLGNRALQMAAVVVDKVLVGKRALQMAAAVVVNKNLAVGTSYENSP
jgi:hypothetical protein